MTSARIALSCRQVCLVTNRSIQAYLLDIQAHLSDIAGCACTHMFLCRRAGGSSRGSPNAPRTPVQLEGCTSTCLSTMSDLLDFASMVNYRRRFFRMKRKLVVREGRSTQIPERETRRRRRRIKYNPSHLLQGPGCEVFLSHSYV